MKKSWLLLGATGVLCACSDAGGVDPDAVAGPELHAVRAALDSAFLNDTTLDSTFAGGVGAAITRGAGIELVTTNREVLPEPSVLV